MESPSPQLVGQEFVRQYYTLLHERPKYLHRFYSSNSSYIHGGIVEGGVSSQEPAVGQSDIHKRIMALNFSECHTKIRQVDSQATVAGAVVVQVTGELSNNGSPMRRFMQTFVLAPQSPNKYYVHNDIFRYQDEVFLDDSDSGDDEPPSQDAVPAVRQAAVGPQPSEQVPAVSRIEDVSQHLPLTAASQQPASAAAAGTESGHAADVRTGGEPSLAFNKKDDPTRSLGVGSSVEPKQPKTWSNIIAQPSKTAAAAPAVARAVDQLPPAAASQAAGSAHEATTAKAADQQQQLLPPNASSPSELPEPSSAVGPAPSASDGTGLVEGVSSQEVRPLPAADFVRPKYYPDSQQVFVGNLPAGTVEEDVKALFADSGEILSVKVITSPSSNKPYAFVVFSDADSAQRVLAKRDYTCKGQYINVEEKRPQQRYPRGGAMNRYNSAGYYHPRGGGGSYYSRGGAGRQGPAGASRRGGQLPPPPSS